MVYQQAIILDNHDLEKLRESLEKSAFRGNITLEEYAVNEKIKLINSKNCYVTSIQYYSYLEDDELKQKITILFESPQTPKSYFR